MYCRSPLDKDLYVGILTKEGLGESMTGDSCRSHWSYMSCIVSCLLTKIKTWANHRKRSL